jgi:Protein of unknown function (DUF2442)
MDETPLDPRFEAMFAEADRRGTEMMKTEPRAISARYDAGSDRIVIELVNGCTLIVPLSNLQDFQNIERDERMADIVVEGLGFNINWPGLNIDLYTPALVAGIFGTKRWMEKALARRAGQAKSPAKAAAARANGAKGGRPRKVA